MMPICPGWATRCDHRWMEETGVVYHVPLLGFVIVQC
jgi:hypothetical protein